MPRPHYALLENRAVLAVSGPDATEFLQGLISQDVSKADDGRALYGALLTPQGKYLHDFFVVRHADIFWLDCETARRNDLTTRLHRYRLRSKVEINDDTASRAICAIFGDAPEDTFGLPPEPGATTQWGEGLVYVDPRLSRLGCRTILPQTTYGASFAEAGLIETSFSVYDVHRLALGAPDGSRDMEVDKTTLLEANFDELNGIDWRKGCYVGQEITARMKHRGLLKKRLLPVRIDGTAPPPGTPITAGTKTVGTLRSTNSDRALALLQLDSLDLKGSALIAGDAMLIPEQPDWLNLR